MPVQHALVSVGVLSSAPVKKGPQQLTAASGARQSVVVADAVLRTLLGRGGLGQRHGHGQLGGVGVVGAGGGGQLTSSVSGTESASDP
jgi:hypothetical protein